MFARSALFAFAVFFASLGFSGVAAAKGNDSFGFNQSRFDDWRFGGYSHQMQKKKYGSYGGRNDWWDWGWPGKPKPPKPGGGHHGGGHHGGGHHGGGHGHGHGHCKDRHRIVAIIIFAALKHWSDKRDDRWDDKGRGRGHGNNGHGNGHGHGHHHDDCDGEPASK